MLPGMGDPTGMIEALAEIPAGQLSERQMRIASGIALVRDNNLSYEKASKECGIPTKTLWRHCQGHVALTDEKGVQVNERALVAASFDMAQIAADKITTRLLDTEHDWKDGDLVKVYGVATDKIAMKRRWAQGNDGGSERSQDTLANALEELRGKTVTITDADPASQAIEVSATTHTDE